MKLKKYNYLIVFMLVLLIGINGVDAKVNKKCYYMEENRYALAILDVKDGAGWGAKTYSEVEINKLDDHLDNKKVTIDNWYASKNDKITGMTINQINGSKKEAKTSHTCPEYLIIQAKNNYKNYKVYATNSKTVAEQFVEKSNNTGTYKASYLKYKDNQENEYTADEYYGSFSLSSGDAYDPNAKITCDQLFGDKNDDGKENDVNRDGNASVAYFIDSILQYVRVIVPILIIVLGVLDFSKAVIASKEDEMRKAQLTFIKRLLLGLIVFFVPLIVDIIMNLADIVWETYGYTSCEFR